jgi:hypothetical protein
MFESCRDRQRVLRDYANKISYLLAVRSLFTPENSRCTIDSVCTADSATIIAAGQAFDLAT